MRRIMKQRIKSKSILIENKPRNVYRAFIDPNVITKWLRSHSAVIAAVKNGPYALGWDASPEGDFYCCCGKISNVKPGQYIHISDMHYYCFKKKFIGPIDLKFKLHREGKFTKLVFTQKALSKNRILQKNFDAVYCSWEEAFYLLKKYLEKSENFI